MIITKFIFYFSYGPLALLRNDFFYQSSNAKRRGQFLKKFFIVVRFNLCCLLFGLSLNVHAHQCLAQEKNVQDQYINNFKNLARIFSSLFTLLAIWTSKWSAASNSTDNVEDDGLCRFIVLLTGLPYLLFLFNPLLSLLRCALKKMHVTSLVATFLLLYLPCVINSAFSIDRRTCNQERKKS